MIPDQKALDEANVEMTTEVKLNVPGIKLRNMLKLLLEQASQPLTYVIEDEVLKITTVEKANEKLSIRMYPVGDLILGPRELQAMTGGAGGARRQRGGHWRWPRWLWRRSGWWSGRRRLRRRYGWRRRHV